MKTLLAVLLLVSFPVLAQQAGTVTFGAPTTGGAPTGYRLYRDGTQVGTTVTSGQTVANLFPTNTGTWVIGVEAFNTAGAGPRVTRTVTLGPVIQPPGPIPTITITAPCATAVPATCVITVVP